MRIQVRARAGRRHEQLPALRLGDLALTATRLAGGGATAEVARRQSDGSWRWVLDRPDVVPGGSTAGGSSTGAGIPK